MAIRYHPERGTILICDFHGLKEPEMVKKRPVIVISPQISCRNGLCTIVALSTTCPSRIMPYHYELKLDPVLPPPYDSPFHWVKGDMIYTFGFERLDLPSKGRGTDGKRKYDIRVINKAEMKIIETCVLKSIGC
ncbi:MAG: type II toxin-antitoxin system PemK/MazF family toxin [Anaerolineae bacterium]|nr:type II toxin-antitoxin system PemK/MazF family toxin [Anaerolineae bacterium]